MLNRVAHDVVETGTSTPHGSVPITHPRDDVLLEVLDEDVIEDRSCALQNSGEFDSIVDIRYDPYWGVSERHGNVSRHGRDTPMWGWSKIMRHRLYVVWGWGSRGWWKKLCDNQRSRHVLDRAHHEYDALAK